MSGTTLVNKPPTTVTYRSPPNFYVFFKKDTAVAPQSPSPIPNNSVASQTETTNI